jgi:hypothetical protein
MDQHGTVHVEQGEVPLRRTDANQRLAVVPKGGNTSADDFFDSRYDRFDGLTQLSKSVPLLLWEPRQILVDSTSAIGPPATRW